MRPQTRQYAGLAVLLLLGGCRSTANVPLTGEPREAVSFSVVSDTIEPDAQLDAQIAPFRERLVVATNVVIGHTPVELTRGQPESLLGNMAADAMLSVVQDLTSAPVDMALTNTGGLRTSVGPGDITVGRMFELMPFDNLLVVLDLTAVQVDSLAQQIARNGGDPIAGFSFVIEDERATDIRVAGERLDPARTYRVVTADYLADGGGNYDVLWDVTTRTGINYLLRDAFITWVRETGTVNPTLDGRIIDRGSNDQ